MRAHFGGYFFGQVATFVYLTQTMGHVRDHVITAAQWPQFSLYNLLVANFWPAYWAGHFIDGAKLTETYWHVFDVAQDKVQFLFALAKMVSGTT